MKSAYTLQYLFLSDVINLLFLYLLKDSYYYCLISCRYSLLTYKLYSWQRKLIRCHDKFHSQSSLIQYSTMKSYKPFFLANSNKSSPVFFLKLRSIMKVSNHSFTISFLISILMSPERTAQNKGVLLYIINNMLFLPFNCLKIKDFIFVMMVLKLINKIFEHFYVSIVRCVVENCPEVACLRHFF